LQVHRSAQRRTTPAEAFRDVRGVEPNIGAQTVHGVLELADVAGEGAVGVLVWLVPVVSPMLGDQVLGRTIE
jgi:hypothetical protein